MDTPNKPKAVVTDASKVVVAINFQSNMKRLRERVQAYFSNKQKANIKDITDVVTVEEYNSNYGLLDTTIADIVMALTKECTARRAYHLGNIPDFEYGDNSLLRAKACNCAHNPISVASKKTVRALAERFLSKWSKDCGTWIGKGMVVVSEKDMYEKPQTEKPKGITTTVKTTKTQTAEKEKEAPKRRIVVKYIK